MLIELFLLISRKKKLFSQGNTPIIYFLVTFLKLLLYTFRLREENLPSRT